MRLPVLLLLGGATGVIVALGLYVTKLSYVGLVPAGLLAVSMAMVVKNFRVYWFVVFLLTLQFTISKNLNDGFAVIEALKIDYTIWAFTFDVTATDLVLLLLLAVWTNDRMFHRKPLHFPGATWFAVGFLGICLLSTLQAPSRYLGFVELSRQLKFFVVFVLAVNWLDSKTFLRVLVLVGVAILVTQAGVTIGRVATGNFTPIAFGESGQSLAQIEQYLTVDRADEGSGVRGFGTLGSPGSTLRLCMMVIPFALFLCVPNAMYGRRPVFIALTGFGLFGLSLTFTRVYYITTAIQLGLAFLILTRDGVLRRQEIIVAVFLGVIATGFIAPKIYEQFTVRTDSVSVRFLQYEATAAMILDHPLLGIGLNNGTAQKHQYVTVTFNRFDADTQFYLEPTHNLYLSLASEIGVVGAFLFVGFFVKAAMAAWRASRTSADPEIRLVANALLVAFCSVAVNGLMDPLGEYHVQVLLWLFAGISFNLSRLAQDHPAPVGPPT